MHFDDEIILLCVVDVEEEAVTKLAEYFQVTVDAIASGGWSQYLPEKKRRQYSLRLRLIVSRVLMLLPPVSCYNLRAYAGLSLSAGKVWHSLSGLLITQPTLPVSNVF